MRDDDVISGPKGSDAPSGPAVPHRRSRTRSRQILLVGDLLAIVLAYLTSVSDPPWYEIITGVVLIVALLLARQYQMKMSLHVLDDLPRLVAATIVAGAASAAILALITQSLLGGRDQIFLAALVVLVVVVRTATYWLVRELRRRGHLRERTVILGAGQVARDLGVYMVTDGSYGCTLVGYVDSDPALPDSALPASNLGPSENMATIVSDERVDQVIIAFTVAPEDQLVPIIQTCDRAEVSMYIVPRLFELTAQRGASDEIDGIPLQHLHRAPFRSPTWWLKRAIDITVSGLALLLLSPLLLLLALINRIVDGPGVLFRQHRVGIDDVEFELLKFRSLRPASETESATNWNVKHDDRLSWFGKFLRRSSLDELPQLWNIFRGDMSLVGPRPERPHFVDEFSDRYARYDARHRVPCGLTGWAQIHGLRGDTSIEERARYDNYYIQNWTLWLDLKIMLRTLTAFMKGSG